MLDVAAAKTRLTAQLADLQSRRAGLADTLLEPLSPDLSEQAVELEDDDPLGGQIVVIDREIAATEAALARVDDGTYGECVRCGNDIAPKRLEVQPEAALCIECASQA